MQKYVSEKQLKCVLMYVCTIFIMITYLFLYCTIFLL